MLVIWAGARSGITSIGKFRHGEFISPWRQVYIKNINNYILFIMIFLKLFQAEVVPRPSSSTKVKRLCLQLCRIVYIFTLQAREEEQDFIIHRFNPPQRIFLFPYRQEKNRISTVLFLIGFPRVNALIYVESVALLQS